MNTFNYIRVLRLTGRGFLFFIALALLAFSLLSGAEGEGIATNSPNAIPGLVFLLIVVVVLKWEFIGGVLTVAFGVFTVIFFNAFNDLFLLVYVSIPIIFTGALFIFISHITTKNLIK
jgi:hypothetical protein